MLDFNGIQVWVSCPDGTDVHATAQTQQRDYESVATIAYGRRREFTLHWHTMDSPIPYSALFVVYVKNDKTSREKKAAVIFLKKGWTDSRTQKSNLEKEFRDGLRFPYTPRSKENQNQIEGSVRLEVYQNPRIPATKHVLKLDDYLQHLNKPFAVFRFNFVFGCNESFADDESSSDFEADSAASRPPTRGKCTRSTHHDDTSSSRSAFPAKRERHTNTSPPPNRTPRREAQLLTPSSRAIRTELLL